MGYLFILKITFKKNSLLGDSHVKKIFDDNNVSLDVNRVPIID